MASEENKNNDEKAWPNMYEEGHNMMVISTAMFFLGKMRKLAKEGEMPDKRTAERILETPITIDEILDAIDANRDVIHELEGETKFGDKVGLQRVQLHAQMLRSSMRGSMVASEAGPNPAQTWQMIEFVDEKAEEELVYAITVDDVNKRIVVAFRGSVTKKDWTQNVDSRRSWDPNPLFGREDMGNFGHDGKVQQPKTMVMHRGFRDYVFEPGEANGNGNGKDGTTKFDAIMESAARALQDRPGYDLYTTGLSLGGALTTVFAMHAAASEDPRIPKPITCYNFGSPKVGSMSFRKAFQSLEEKGKLRCVRVANEGDPVKELPQNPLRYMDHSCAAICQPFFYRHVGMTLFLHQEKGFSFQYTRLTRNYFRILWDDWVVEDLNCRVCCENCCKMGCGAESAGNFRQYHGYPEYLHRLEINREGIRQQDLGRTYQEAKDKKVPCLICPFFCPPPTPEEREMRVHYY